MYNQLTEKDIQAMEAEIEDRKLNVRPKLLEAVKEARAQGDLSENFEYYAAKKEKNRHRLRSRISNSKRNLGLMITAFPKCFF